MNKRYLSGGFGLLLLSPLLLANDDCQGPPSAQQIEQHAVTQNQENMLTDTRPPVLTTSLERKNLIKRLQRVNSQNMSGYIYLISQGTVMASYPVAGKISSLNSYLATDQKYGYACSDDPSHNMCNYQTVEQPDFDGAYGKNDDGIFFFTADTDTYVEWHGEYLFSDQPLVLNQEPKLYREVKP